MRGNMTPKVIKLPIDNIVVTIDDNHCYISSEISDGTIGGDFDIAAHIIESMILAHAAAGVDIESPAYVSGIKVVVEAAMNHLT